MKLYNSQSRTKEKFVPINKNEVTIYSCGPTVYDYAHIGNFRSFLMSDLLTRVLQYAGYKTQKVMNITDVGHLTNDDLADANGEDKIGKKAAASGKTAWEIAEFYTQKFEEDEQALRILLPTHRPKATEFIKEQIDIAKTLQKRGFAYEVNGSFYFRVAAFEQYGKLSGNSLENLQAGSRVEVLDEKESPLDFALWKSGDEKHLMQWDFATGEKISDEKLAESPNNKFWGFPGWHVECSAMSRAYLGDRFDIHTGGEDNLFPHHECEIAQNECSCAPENQGKNSVNYWMHAKHLLVEGQKMSKSKGNFYTIRDLFEQGWTGNEIRFLLLSAHYRTAMNFSMDGLTQAKKNIERITEAKNIFAKELQNSESKKIEYKIVKNLVEKYKESLFDDLNVSDALATVFEIIKTGLKAREEKNLSTDLTQEIHQFLTTDFDQVFDIFPEEKTLSDEKMAQINALIDLRAMARTEKNWAESDRIRDELLENFGVKIKDSGTETNWELV